MSAVGADVEQRGPDTAAPQPAPPAAPRPLVELAGVSRRYGRLVALKDVSLSVAPGEFVFVTGPSEAGKTTLLRLIHGDLRPTRGTARVARSVLHRRWRRSLPRLRRRAAAVFQDGRLLRDMTAHENVAFAIHVADLWLPHREVRARARARLEEVGLGRRAGAYPHQLSGGQLRRLALARALAHDPQLLIADEPTANLDRRSAELVLRLLERRSRAGTAVIVATHDLDLTRSRPHRVIELKRGQVVADTPARRADDAATRLAEPAGPTADDEPEMVDEHPVRDRLRALWAGAAALGRRALRRPPAGPAEGRRARPRPWRRLRAGLRALARRALARPGSTWPARRVAHLRARLGALARRALRRPARPARPAGAAQGRSAGAFVLALFPARARRPWVPLANVGRLVLGGALTSWRRNFGTTAPALGSMALLLLLAGVVSISVLGVRTVLGVEASEASTLHVYLSDGVTDDQVTQLRAALASQAHVRSVRYVDKAQALALARQRPGLVDLAAASDTNPFPASLDVQVDRPADVGAVARTAAAAPGVDERRPTSYDQGTYERLRQFTLVGAGVVAGFAALLLFITYAVSANSIRAAVLARRDELLTMQLVGASRWLVRARLGVEGALTGGSAGLLAALALVGACVAALTLARQLFVDVLPGVTPRSAAALTAAVVAVGLGMGAVAALFASRRVRA